MRAYLDEHRAIGSATELREFLEDGHGLDSAEATRPGSSRFASALAGSVMGAVAARAIVGHGIAA